MPAKPPIVKRAPRTVKEKKFIKEYTTNGGNGTRAALKVYDTTSEGSAAQIAYEKLRKLDMNFYFYEAGLTNEVMAQAVTRKALTAKKQNNFTGEIDDDHTAQLNALKLAAQLMGLIKAGDTINNTQNNIVVTPIYGGQAVINKLSTDENN